MPTNTATGIALTRSKPIQNNIGEILLEHAKYMQKYKSEQEYKDWLKASKQREYDRKLNKQIQDGLPVAESDSYWKEQVSKLADSMSDEYYNDAILASQGDKDAIMRNSQRKQMIDDFNNAGKAVTAKFKELAKNNTANQYRDKELLELVESAASGLYRIDDKTRRIIMYNKDGTKVLLDVDPKTMAQEIFNTKFHTPPTWVANADAIAENLLEENDYVKEWDSKAKARALSKTNNYFKENYNDGLSFFIKQKDEGLFKTDKRYDQLNQTDLNILSTQYVDEFVRNRVVGETKTLDKRQKEASIRATNALTAKRYAEKEKVEKETDNIDKGGRKTIYESTDINGQPIKGYKVTKKGKRTPVNVTNAYHFVDDNVKVGDVTYNTIYRDEDGDIGFIGTKPIPKDKQKKNKAGITPKEIDVVTQNVGDMNIIIGKIGRLKGDMRFENVNDLSEYLYGNKEKNTNELDLSNDKDYQEWLKKHNIQ